MQVGTSDRLLTTKEVAVLLCISASTLAKRRLKGLPPSHIKIGRAVRYSLRVVLDFASASSRRSTSQATPAL